MIVAITTTTRRFGPSGSLKNRNIAREHTRDVMPKMSKEDLFDLRFICWGGRDRTFVWRLQRPLPYRLATPQNKLIAFSFTSLLALNFLISNSPSLLGHRAY